MIALLSNVTVGSLALQTEKSLGEKVLVLPGFDTWKAGLLNPKSPLWRNDVEIICLVLHGPALFPEGMDARFADVLSEPLRILSQARAERGNKTFVVSTLDLPSSPALPLAGRDFAVQAGAWWRAELEKMDLPVLDLRELAAEAGRKHFYSAKMWYYGALPFSRLGENLLAREILRVVGAVRGGRRKCLVLDLDNTLWGGAIGEEGLQGIELSSSGTGSRYRDAQRVAKELAEQGVLLAISSKNNMKDALAPFREHPHMLLKEEDFVKIKTNWEPKPANIAAIARELNIGLDSLVFIDDNPVEREAVRLALPEVAVPDFPSDTSRLPAFMAEVARTCFTALRVEDEDRGKTEMYRAESKREEERNVHLSLSGYLASLGMVLDLHPLRRDEIARAAQLTQKTNQFNLTVRRYTEAEIAAMLQDASVRIWMAALRDRFGDYGRIGLAAARLSPTRSAVIGTFLMSCRVMGRGVDDAILSGVEQALAGEGVTAIFGEYRAAARNDPVRGFWEEKGYAQAEVTPEGSLWVLRAPFEKRNTAVQYAVQSSGLSEEEIRGHIK
ncbi:MAG: HAD-IIIC family phosphatase [Synergistaceae bacterium]|nr:HAD-IIIC family phosphatase [Synergistaceae bacterium]